MGERGSGEVKDQQAHPSLWRENPDMLWSAAFSHIVYLPSIIPISVGGTCEYEIPLLFFGPRVGLPNESYWKVEFFPAECRERSLRHTHLQAWRKAVDSLWTATWATWQRSTGWSLWSNKYNSLTSRKKRGISINHTAAGRWLLKTSELTKEP